MCSRTDDPSNHDPIPTLFCDQPTQDDQDEMFEVLLYPHARVENHGTIARAEVVLDGVDRWIVAEPRLLRDAVLASIDLNEPVTLLVPRWALS